MAKSSKFDVTLKTNGISSIEGTIVKITEEGVEFRYKKARSSKQILTQKPWVDILYVSGKEGDEGNGAISYFDSDYEVFSDTLSNFKSKPNGFVESIDENGDPVIFRGNIANYEMEVDAPDKEKKEKKAKPVKEEKSKKKDKSPEGSKKAKKGSW